VTAADRHLGYRPHIDGLRAVAVVLVVAFHAGYAALPGGFVGVDVFFVLSGYLITRILVAELVVDDRLRLGRFYARRMRRLLPASALTLTAIVVAAHGLLDRAQQQPVARDVRWSALWAANWRFVDARLDYFAPGDVPSPVVHYWSLAVEEQFYLVWPALLLGLWFLLSRGARVPTRRVVGAVAAVGVASAVASVVLTPSTAAYYGTHTRAYQLMAGAVLALVVVRREAGEGSTAAGGRWSLAPPLATIVGLVGLAAVGLVAWRTTGAADYPGWAALVVTGGTVAVVVVLETCAGTVWHRVLGARAPAAIGRVSYSLYLWHWPVLVFVPIIAARHDIGWLDRRPVMFALMGVLATTSYLAFERPIRFRLVPRAPWSAVVGAGLVVTVLVAGLVAGRLYPEDHDQAIALAAVKDLAAPGHCPYFAEDWPSDAADAQPCSWRQGGRYTVLLVGDSHAQMWQPALDDIAARHDLTVIRLTRGGCPANDITVYHLGDEVGAKEVDRACSEWREDLYPRAIAEYHPDLVLVSSRSHVLGMVDGGDYLLPSNDGYLDRWEQAWERTLGWLTAGGAQVVVSEILPTLPQRVPACLAAHGLHTTVCDWPVTVDRRVPRFNEVLAGLPSRVPGVAVIDPTALACPGGTCPARIDGVIVHRDDNHLSRSWAARLGPGLERLLLDAGVRLPARTGG